MFLIFHFFVIVTLTVYIPAWHWLSCELSGLLEYSLGMLKSSSVLIFWNSSRGLWKIWVRKYIVNTNGITNLFTMMYICRNNMVISGKNHILIKLKQASCVLYPNIRYIFILQILGMMPLNSLIHVTGKLNSELVDCQIIYQCYKV